MVVRIHPAHSKLDEPLYKDYLEIHVSDVRIVLHPLQNLRMGSSVGRAVDAERRFLLRPLFI